MSEIRSLADQIREKLKAEEQEARGITIAENPLKSCPEGMPASYEMISSERLAAFFRDIDQFSYSGREKSMIRVDADTIKLLKRLKLATGIDMNKFIVYCLHHFLSQHSWLPHYITETLKNPES